MAWRHRFKMFRSLAAIVIAALLLIAWLTWQNSRPTLQPTEVEFFPEYEVILPSGPIESDPPTHESAQDSLDSQAVFILKICYNASTWQV